jgi:hypothetical protein
MCWVLKILKRIKPFLPHPELLVQRGKAKCKQITPTESDSSWLKTNKQQQQMKG